MAFDVGEHSGTRLEAHVLLCSNSIYRCCIIDLTVLNLFD